MGVAGYLDAGDQIVEIEDWCCVISAGGALVWSVVVGWAIQRP